MKTYYQPIEYFDDGVNIGWGDVPDGLWDFQAFASREDAEYWLKEHGYESGNFNITEYHDDDIEDVVIIDGDGNVVGDSYPEILFGQICNYLATYESDDTWSACDLIMWGKDLLEAVKDNWDELRSNK